MKDFFLKPHRYTVGRTSRDTQLIWLARFPQCKSDIIIWTPVHSSTCTSVFSWVSLSYLFLMMFHTSLWLHIPLTDPQMKLFLRHQSIYLIKTSLKSILLSQEVYLRTSLKVHCGHSLLSSCFSLPSCLLNLSILWQTPGMLFLLSASQELHLCVVPFSIWGWLLENYVNSISIYDSWGSVFTDPQSWELVWLPSSRHNSFSFQALKLFLNGRNLSDLW